MPTVDTTLGIRAVLAYLHATNASDMVFWTPVEIIRWFNDHLRRLGQDHALFVARDITSVTIVAGTASYSLPTRTQSVFYAAHNNKPLIASSTHELEMLDVDYLTTPGIPTHFYTDKIGANKIGLYPVPTAAAVTLSSVLDLVICQYSPLLDDAQTNTFFTGPNAAGDALEFAVAAEMTGMESDASQPEIAQACRAMKGIYDAAFAKYWNKAL
jgi:hypothetical protein